MQKQLQPQRRRGAKGRKGKPNQKFFAAFLCAFAPLRLSLFSAFPLRPCAFAVMVFRNFSVSLWLKCHEKTRQFS
ncbi:MAG TPA: hypothetical protein VFM11_12040, partial [Burkholderiales bacterium]|nr:hypothetical protein [Burkholderiales bacterium]